MVKRENAGMVAWQTHDWGFLLGRSVTLSTQSGTTGLVELPRQRAVVIPPFTDGEDDLLPEWTLASESLCSLPVQSSSGLVIMSPEKQYL